MIRVVLLTAAIGGLVGLALVDVANGDLKTGIAAFLVAVANLLFLT